MTLEKDWQRDIIRLAQTLGWRVAHFRPAQTSKGWRTAVGADGAGFPDLVLVRDRVVFVELKNEKGRMSEQQLEWKAALEVAGAEYYLWRPDDLDDAMAVLLERQRRDAPVDVTGYTPDGSVELLALDG
jgi:hypothetical protein